MDDLPRRNLRHSADVPVIKQRNGEERRLTEWMMQGDGKNSVLSFRFHFMYSCSVFAQRQVSPSILINRIIVFSNFSLATSN